MMSRSGQKIIPVRILSNISRRKGNPTMKFGQLIECNIRNIYLEKSCTKCGEKQVPNPFIKNQN